MRRLLSIFQMEEEAQMEEPNTVISGVQQE